jgi:hypothetical protein
MASQGRAEAATTPAGGSSDPVEENEGTDVGWWTPAPAGGGRDTPAGG